ncbi:hypothetical protein FA13DRAFT_1819370 [Coprinellus micaceus]|uniref:DUF6533 domain-containing protein n=1 Tax=Coprinellus micaceus TaxID=71717 RepID=A0A4Y7SIN5_COPMI|nr:hypothetical protein FA13DRAFT_1819370 [Coprinellus micaceus]
MDPEIVAEITAQIPMYQAWQILQFTQLAVFTALFYHYALTLDDEVSQIWPQPTWKMGKIFFLTTRYSAMTYMSLLLALNWPHHISISVPACEALGLFADVSGLLVRTFAEATLWLCLYALLGGKPKFFYFWVIAFLGLSIPAIVLSGMHIMSQRAIPQNTLDHLLGNPCNFLLPQRPDLQAISSYIVFSRTSLALIVGLVTLFVRYRKQNNKLIKVIRREGGIFYFSTLILLFFSCLVSTPGSPVKDEYRILWCLKNLFVNVFADRLLLKMKKVDDRSTQAVISTLVFDHDERTGSSLSDTDEESHRDEGEVPIQEKEGIVAAFETSGKAMRERVGDGGDRSRRSRSLPFAGR